MHGEDCERLRETQAEDDRRDNNPSGMHGILAPSGMHGILAPSGMHGILAPSGMHGILAPSGMHGILAPSGMHGILAPSGMHGILVPSGMHGIWAPSGMHGIWVPTGMPNPQSRMLANQGPLNDTVLLHRFAPMHNVVQQCDPVHQLHYTPSYEIGNEPVNYSAPLTVNAPLPVNRFDRIYAAGQQYEPVRQHYHTPSHEIVNYYAPPPVNGRQCELAHEPSSYASSNSVGNEPRTSCAPRRINFNIPFDMVGNEPKKSNASAVRNNKIPNSLVAPINYDGRIYEGWTPSYEVGDEPVNYCAPLTANRFDRIYAAGQQYEPVRRHYHTPSHEIVNYYAPPPVNGRQCELAHEPSSYASSNSVGNEPRTSCAPRIINFNIPLDMVGNEPKKSNAYAVRNNNIPNSLVAPINYDGRIYEGWTPSYEVGDEPVNYCAPLTANRFDRIYAAGQQFEPVRQHYHTPSHEIVNYYALPPSSYASSNSVGNEPRTSCAPRIINFNIPLDMVGNEPKKSNASAVRNNKIPNSLVAPINYDGRIYEGWTPSYEVGDEPVNYCAPLTANRFDRIYAPGQQYEPVRQHYHTPSHEIVNYYALPPSSYASSNSVGNEPGTSCVPPIINNISLDEVRNESKKSYASAVRNNKKPTSPVAAINNDGRICKASFASNTAGNNPSNFYAPPKMHDIISATRACMNAGVRQYEPRRDHSYVPSYEVRDEPQNSNRSLVINDIIPASPFARINAGVRHYELPCEDSYAPSYVVGDEPVNSNRPLTVNDIIPASRLARIYAPGREYEPAREACYKPSHEVENEATYSVNIGSSCENLEVWQLPEVEYYFRKLTKKDPDEH